MNIKLKKSSSKRRRQAAVAKLRRDELIVRRLSSGGSSVSQNKLPKLILGYIYILKYLQSNFIG